MKTNHSSSQFATEFHLMKRACQVIRQLQPGYLELSLIRALLNAAVPYIAITISAMMIDELVGGKDLNTLLFYVLVSVGGTAFFTVIASVLTKKIDVYDKMFVVQIKHYMNRKIYTMDYSALEDSRFIQLHAKIVNIMFLINSGMVSVVQLLGELSLHLASMAIAVVILFSSSLNAGGQNAGYRMSSFLFFLLTLAAIGVSVFLSARNSRTVSEKQYNLTQNNSTNHYLDYYHDDYMADDKAAKDIHIFDQRDLIIREIMERGRAPWMKALLKRYSLYQKYYGLNILITTFIGGYAYIYVGLRALAGFISLGSVTKSYASITMLINALSSVSLTLSQIKSNNKYIRDFFDFMDLPSAQHTGTKIPDSSVTDWEIAFHHVSFRYPNCTDYVLKDISFVLSSGARTAVVGMNGSGKTTMIKLLCGLYQPEEGYITLNGTDIREYDYVEYLKLFTVVFQDFKLLALPIGENISISKAYSEQEIWKALEAAGADTAVRRMPQELSQYLYHYVDGNGIDISGGEEQKLAIARAYHKKAAFVIMDEPTAALDPVSEYDIYTRLNTLIEDRAAVFISHRLSSCRFCDNILVFDQGKIVQTGGHDALVQDSQGKYYDLWTSQAQYYK